MPRPGEYSNKYGFHVSNIEFNCGGEPTSRGIHGTLTTADIAGAQPKRFTAERAHPSPAELEASTQGRSKYRPPAQPRNPLAPDYHLPPVPPPPNDPIKFIRDTLDVSDIAGTHKTERAPLSKPDTMLNTSDIEGSWPGWRSQRRQATGAGTDAAPRSDARLDVSDIATKVKQPAARKMETHVIAPLDDGLGKPKGIEREKEHYENLRRRGNDVAKARQEAESLLDGVPLEKASKTTAALEAAFKALDIHGAGVLQAKEFEAAVQRSGINLSAEKTKALSKSLAAADSGMVAYHDVLSRLYDKSITAHDTADIPNWYLARQRRVKTSVAVSLGQQPDATAAAAAKAITSQDDADLKKGCGKKIIGLAQLGDGGKGGETYWFAECLDNPLAANKAAESGDQDGSVGIAGGQEGLWFSKGGGDEKSVQEMAAWRPTQDVAIAIDLRKERKSKQSASAGASPAVEGLLPLAKAPLASSRPPPVSRKAQAAAQKDVALVRQLE